MTWGRIVNFKPSMMSVRRPEHGLGGIKSIVELVGGT
jgi:hypothetical protein